VIDLFVTSKAGRPGLTSKSLESLVSSLDSVSYRLTLYLDGADHELLRDGSPAHFADHLIVSRDNEGLGPAINRIMAHIKSTNNYYSHPQARDSARVSQFVCGLQDDVVYEDRWLERLVKFFCLHEQRHNLGFATGHNCVEHETVAELPGGMMLKRWIRMTCVLGRREYWESMMPIPRFDPETGRVRAKPNDGVGSGVDWHIIRNHENSIDRTGRKCLVVPGLVKHIGYADSTWLKRELPESDEDRADMP
jgi:hypothetical protein